MKKQYIMAAIIGVTLICGMVLAGCGESEHDSKPGAPAEISAAAVSSSVIKIEWSSVNYENQILYYVYRSTNLEGPYTKIDTSSGISNNYYSEGGLSAGTTYYYKVSAYYRYYGSKNGGKLEEVVVEGALSSAASATTLHADKPTEVKLSLESKSSIKVSWKAVTGAAGYKVYRSLSADIPPSNIKTITTPATNSYTDTGLAENVTYYYTVSAYSASGEGAQSSVVSVKIAIPDVPVSAVLETSDGRVMVSWFQVSGAEGYKVYRSVSEGSGYALNATIPPSSSTTSKAEDGRTIITYIDSGMTLNTKYYYTVSAFNNVGESSRSLPDTATPTLPNLQSSLTGSIDLSSDYNWHVLNIDPGLVFVGPNGKTINYYIVLEDSVTSASSYTGIVYAAVYDINMNLLTTITSSSTGYQFKKGDSKFYIKVYYRSKTGSYNVGYKSK